MLPDGITAIANIKDIGRTLLLAPAVAGCKFYMVDDALNRTYMFNVNQDGSLSNPELYAEVGRFGVTVLPDGAVLAPDGYLHFIVDGKITKRMRAPERVVCAAVMQGGIALLCRKSVYIMKCGF